MPIYEYICEDCGAHVEALVRLGEEPERCGMLCRPSPQVRQYGAGKLVRQVSVASVPHGEQSRLGAKDTPDDKRIAKAGLTKYVNEGNGKFKKAAGEGPDVIYR